MGLAWLFFCDRSDGFRWPALWLWIYRLPGQGPQCPVRELEHLRPETIEGPDKIGLSEIVRHRQTWAIVCGKFLVDPIWWFYLFWIPDFLERRHGLSLGQIGLPILIIYVLADFGSVAGGWLSSFLLRRGKTVNLARKVALLVCAAIFLVVASRVDSLWTAVLLIGLAAATRFSANF